LAQERDKKPRLYNELAGWWHLLSDPADYAEEAALFVKLLKEACARPPVTVLELGCGGGNNASHMKTHFDMTLSDVSPGMIEASRSVNPECEHVVGDMRTLRLGRTFDAVFVHDAIAYMASEDDLRAAMMTAFVHCRPGGVALFAPDYVAETFRPQTSHGGHDGPARSMRYLEWDHEPEEGASTFVSEFAFLLRGPDGVTRVEYDAHTAGLFKRKVWLALLQEVGFKPRLDRTDPCGREVFVCTRPA
jgi:SAM-dependent methyltransferase